MARYNCKPPALSERLLQKSKPEQLEEQQLERCLSLFDLTIQGVAHIVGGGIFVMTPSSVALIAGPSLGFSMIIASMVIFLTVLCYMDLGSRYTTIGNAYVYVYTTLGELPAVLTAVFVCGECALGLPLISHGVSDNLDRFFFNGSIHRAESEFFNLYLGSPWDDNISIITIGTLVTGCVINLIGIRWVAVTNTFVVIYSVLTLVSYCGTALVVGDYNTFSNSTDPTTGRGGVFPYGIEGVLEGAAVSVIAFTGFETLVSLASEANDPKRDIPKSTIASFVLTSSLFISVAFAISYMMPWYKVSTTTGLPNTLKYHNLHTLMWGMVLAVICACFSSALCNITSLSRIVFRAATDGLFFLFLREITECNQVPTWSVLATTLTAIILSILLPFTTLIHLVSGGVMMIFCVVNLTVIVITYPTDKTCGEMEESSLLDDENQEYKKNKDVPYLTTFYFVLVIVGAVVAKSHLLSLLWKAVILVFIGLIAINVLVWIKLKYKQSKVKVYAKCPWVPFIPGLGIVANVVLIASLKSHAHFVIGVYVLITVVVYFGYGVFYSEVTVQKQKVLEAQN